jgi:4'-phosphopantetheinyl transferase
MRPSKHHVYAVRFCLIDSGDMEDALSLLDDAERARGSRFIRESDRRRFVIAHGFTRLVLGRFLGVPAASLRFSVGSHGKPRLTDADADLRFSLSHSRERAVLAVALAREVGIDIEQERPIAALDLAQRFFSPREFEALAATQPDGRASAFFRCWTRKESFVKARGDGLSFPLSAFDVSLEESAPPLLLACEHPDETARWTIAAVPCDGPYTAALTAAGQDWRLDHCSFTPLRGLEPQPLTTHSPQR